MIYKVTKRSNNFQDEKIEIKEFWNKIRTPQNTDVYRLDRRKFYKGIYNADYGKIQDKF